MHYHAEIWTEEENDSDVTKILTPYEEGIHGYGYNLQGWWDWWQIGGRWKGIHVPGYDATKDPDHIVICNLCHGTGKRPGALEQFGAEWVEQTNGCNGCHGTGEAISHPTLWQQHPQDVIAVSEIPDCLTCHTLVVRGEVYHIDEWTGDEWVKTDFDGNVSEKLRELGVDDGFMVTVDYHS